MYLEATATTAATAASYERLTALSELMLFSVMSEALQVPARKCTLVSVCS
jgi:hypothetical protein